MTNEMIIKAVEEYRSYEALVKEAELQMKELKKQLTDELEARETEVMEVGQYIIKNLEVSSSRFDTKSFKEKLGEELYRTFMKEVLSHRFTIAA